MNILILSYNDTFALNILRNLSSLKSKNYVLGAGKLYGTLLSRYCTKYFKSELEEFINPTNKIKSSIKEICNQYDVNLMIAADMFGTFLISKIKNNIPPSVNIFPISDFDCLEKLHNKWKFANLLKEQNIPIPQTSLLQRQEEIESIDIKFPLIIKPLDLGDRTGVRKLNSKKEVYEHISQKTEGTSLPLLLQEYIPGEDVDLNLLLKEGEVIAWSIQRWVSEEAIEFIEDERIVTIGRRIMKCTNYNGVAHLDMRYDERDGSVKVIECNPRFWGSLRASIWNGINFIEMGIRLANGEMPPPQSAYNQTKYVLPSKILSKLMKGKLSILKNLPLSSKKDLWQIISDPISCTYIIFSKVFRKRH